MRKLILGSLAIALTLFFTGCESEEQRQGRENFEKSAEYDFSKARATSETKFDKNLVQSWIDKNQRLKELEKQTNDFESKQGKHIDYSNYDWDF